MPFSLTKQLLRLRLPYSTRTMSTSEIGTVKYGLEPKWGKPAPPSIVSKFDDAILFLESLPTFRAQAIPKDTQSGSAASSASSAVKSSKKKDKQPKKLKKAADAVDEAENFGGPFDTTTYTFIYLLFFFDIIFFWFFKDVK